MRTREQFWLWPAALLLTASLHLHAQQSAPAVVKPVPSPVRGHTNSLRWNDLSPARQEALSPLKSDWKGMEEDRQKKWLVIADKFATMNPEQRARAQSRMREWVALKPEQRRLARESYLQTKKLDPAQKNAKWERYQQLPEDEKQRLAAAGAKKKRLAALPALPPAQTPVTKPAPH
jgi:hypothetical protein